MEVRTVAIEARAEAMEVRTVAIEARSEAVEVRRVAMEVPDCGHRSQDGDH